MPAGISKAKGRRNSKSKRMAGFQTHPAKAGKRKVYTTGKRKTKTFPDGKQGYCMTHTCDESGMVFNARWSTGRDVMIPATH